MRIYLIKPTADATATASAECDKRAAALEARGFVRCTLGYWRAVRQVNDAKDQERVRKEDARAKDAAPVETAPLGALVTITS